MEKYRKNVYCEKQFLKSYFQFKENHDLDNNHVKKQLLESVENIINSRYIKLYTDITEEDVDDNQRLFSDKNENITEYDKFIYDLLEKQYNNEIHLTLNSKINYNSLDLNALYLTDSLNKGQCEDIKKNYGVIVINIDNLFDYSYALKDQGKAISKRDDFCRSWKDVFANINIMPYNAIVVIDNYILDDTNMMTENIEGLFEAIMPKELNTTFHITIVTSLKKIPYCNDRYNRLRDTVKKLRPNIDFELTIIKSQDFHDRTILTNTMFFSCGAGFDLFRKKQSQKTTTVNVALPLWGDNNIKWVNEAYSNIINDVKKVYNATPEFDGSRINETMPNFYIGNKTNRIIE